MSVVAYRLICFIYFLSSSTGLQIHLADTGEPLGPEQEAALFPRDPPREYRVLRWRSGRSRRSLKEDSNSTSISLQLPIGDSKVDLILDKVNLAVPDLKLSFRDFPEEEEEIPVPQDCFYSGGTSGSWAVISTCSGLMGVVEQGGHPYQVEEVGEPLEQQVSSGRYRRAAINSLVVVYPLTEHLAREAALPPAIPDFDQDSKIGVSDDAGASRDNPLAPSPDVSPLTLEGRGRRVRRRTKKGPYTVELAVFVDRTLYSYVKERYPSYGSGDKTVEIIMTLVNAVHRLYSDASLRNAKIGMLVKRVEVLGSGKPSQSKGDIYKYLKNFCSWQAQENPRSKSKGWDHALLLSGHDLWNKKPSKNSIVGLAFVGGMCSPSFSCTINEGTSFAAAYIIAHEMGHSLNMKHDGQLEARRCKDDKYLMSPVMTSGATTWSSCSKDTLTSFLNTRGSCLTSVNTYTPSDDERNHNGPAPGKRFDAHDQCHYMYGKGWRHFSSTQSPFDDVCREIWCRRGRLLRTPSASALEGTPCGHSKVCARGTCVKAKKTAKQKENEEQGRSGKQVGSKINLTKVGKDDNNKFKRKKTESVDDVRKEKVNKEKERKRKEYKSGVKKTGAKLRENKNGKNGNLKEIKFKRKNNEAGKTEVSKKRKKPKNKTKKGIKENNKNKENKKLIARNEIATVLKTKKKIKNIKKPKKIRRIETPTQIIIKERLKYVEGKGWKIRIMRIKKTKRMIEESKKKKKKKKKKENAKCKKNSSNCRKGDSKKKNSSKKGRKKSKVPKINDSGGATVSSPPAGGRTQCEPEKLKYIQGKGWWVRLPIKCIQPRTARKSI